MYVLNGIVLCLSTQIPRFGSPIRIVRHDHASAAGGDDLIAVKAETADITQMSDLAAFVFGPETLRGIFNNH